MAHGGKRTILGIWASILFRFAISKELAVPQGTTDSCHIPKMLVGEGRLMSPSCYPRFMQACTLVHYRHMCTPLNRWCLPARCHWQNPPQEITSQYWQSTSTVALPRSYVALGKIVWETQTLLPQIEGVKLVWWADPKIWAFSSSHCSHANAGCSLDPMIPHKQKSESSRTLWLAIKSGECHRREKEIVPPSKWSTLFSQENPFCEGKYTIRSKLMW